MMSSLRRLFDALPPSFSDDPLPQAAFFLSVDNIPHEQFTAVISSGIFSLWKDGDVGPFFRKDLSQYKDDGSLYTLGDLACELLTLPHITVRTSPLVLVGNITSTYSCGSTSFPLVWGQTDRNWINCPADMLLDRVLICSPLSHPQEIYDPSLEGAAFPAFSSPLWSLLFPIAREIQRAEKETRDALSNITLPGAQGVWLDNIVNLYGIKRFQDEEDKYLILRSFALLSGTVSNNVSISSALLNIYQVVCQVLDISPFILQVSFDTGFLPSVSLERLVDTIKLFVPAGVRWTLTARLPLLRPLYSFPYSAPSTITTYSPVKRTLYHTFTYKDGHVFTPKPLSFTRPYIPPFTPLNSHPLQVHYNRTIPLLRQGLQATMYGDFVYGMGSVVPAGYQGRGQTHVYRPQDNIRLYPLPLVSS